MRLNDQLSNKDYLVGLFMCLFIHSFFGSFVYLFFNYTWKDSINTVIHVNDSLNGDQQKQYNASGRGGEWGRYTKYFHSSGKYVL